MVCLNLRLDECLAGFELSNGLGFDFDGFASCGVDAFVGSSLDGAEGAKANQGDVVAFFQLCLGGVDALRASALVMEACSATAAMSSVLFMFKNF